MADAEIIEVQFAGGYWLHTYRRLLRNAQPLLDLLEGEQPAVIRIDMSRLTFVSPAALATLVALLMRVRDAGLSLPGSTIAPPRAAGIYRYLHRMDFFRVLYHDPDLPDPSTRAEPSGLLECPSTSSTTRS